ncbi:centromere-associated protein E isoform X3 [Ictalurus punctatus]|uniref:Centromere-associated protein E n=1 Tax=Ictalurus punctatus TaxID=7998 RepID=A0A2D0Q4I6_ICTPU|nr:centromere-associated protein E isoform X3 [Ictalurus punctatus]
MTDESAVKVCVRVRPFIKREEADNAEPLPLYWKTDKQAIHQIDDDGNMTKSFNFDRVFNAEESTNQLYNEIAKPLVVSTVEGYNGTIFAYGQTSSGKTFTMMGSEHNPGVIPLAMADVFHTIKNCPNKEFLLRVSYMEIYNETVTDLLCDSWKRKPLEIREGNYKNVYVADLTEELVRYPEQALAWIRKGEKNRHCGKTKMNERSSRSHAIFRMILESRERSEPASGENADGAIIVSHLNLVDLAGAERASQTGAEGTRFKEGCNINRSLFTLGQVIKKLSDESHKGFTNYRDSKLTRILQNSLGGNAKTVIICTITPATVDETVSTLQFASAAKRMKNDPHVTEVSDDGALLRRYRNEIVDLKRRLQEVSSVTQTTVTEKETLSQLLQEKDQLQREQADRIRNLTKLLVTASNVVPVQKIPKRRVTWGGKLFRSAPLLAGDYGSTDMSFAEPFFKKSKADLTVTEESEEMEEFDTTPCFYSPSEDTSIDLEMNQSHITMRSSAEGVCTDSPQLMFRVGCLERQLETETQEKQKAEENNALLEQRTDELQKQLQTLEQQLETEVQEKQTAEQKCSTLELKIAELEKAPEPEKDNKACEQYLAEAVQLCQTLSSEREVIAAERDMLKQSLDLLTQDMARLKQDNEVLMKDKETLLRDIEERKDAEEFEKLEDESRKDYERELETEISALKRASTDAEDLVQKLKSDLEVMSTELKKKNDLVVDLQSLNGKDLVQEVTQLRRSLDDAEGLSLETKKEWAFLRSENLSLKERDATLTVNYNQMENEVKSLQSQLEHEKSRFRKMQTDLQKELLGAFDENTKLTALLDGKVPKNVLDNVTLGKTVAELKKELEKSQESEGALQSKMEELKSLQALPAKVDDLLRQVCELTGELDSVKEERDSLLSAQAVSNEDNERLKGDAVKVQEELESMQKDLADAELKEVQLSQQHTETTEQLTKVRTDLEHLLEENGSLLSALEEAKQKSVQLGEELESLRCERERHLLELTATTAERNQLQETIHSKVSEQAENVQNLQVELQAITEERDQLKRDLEENVELMIKNQEELRAALQTSQVQQDKILQLEAEKAQLESRLSDPPEDSLVEDLQIQVKQLKEDLQSACSERDKIESEKALESELERMQTSISSLTEERDQLQEILQGLREEKSQLKRELEEKDELIICFQSQSSEKKFSDSNCVSNDEKEVQLQQMQDEELSQQNSWLRTELQDMPDKVGELSGTLRAVQDEKSNLLVAQSTLNEEHLRLKEEMETAREELHRMESQMIDSQLKEAETSQQLMETTEQLMKARADLEHFTVENGRMLTSLEEANRKTEQLGEEIQSVRCERDQLLCEKTEGACDREEFENLRATLATLTEERNQLQEILQGLREEHSQLKRDLEESNDLLVQVQKPAQSEISSQQEATCMQDELQQKLQEQLAELTEENHQLKTDAQENVETMIETQAELRSALANIKELERNVRELEVQKIQLESKLSQTDSSEKSTLVEDLKTQINHLNEELRAVCDEKQRLLIETAHGDRNAEELERARATISALTEERDQLLDVLQGLREEKSQIKSILEEKEEEDMIIQLREEREVTTADRDAATKDSAVDAALETIQASVSALSEERDQLLEILQGLREEKNQMSSELEDKNRMLTQLTDELRSATAEKDNLLAEKSKDELDSKAESERHQVRIASLTEERDQTREENNRLKTELVETNETVMQLRQELQSMSAEREHLLSESTQQSLSHVAEMEQVRSDIAFVTQERDQLLELLQGLRDEKIQLQKDLEEKDEVAMQLKEDFQRASNEKDQLLADDAKCNLETVEELERRQATIVSLTEERDQLLEVLHGMREEKKQLRADLDEKDEMIQQLKALLAEREQLPIKDASCGTVLNEDGDSLQELLQGVRELIQVQGELKQQKPLSPRATRKAELQQANQIMQALKDEVEYLRNERTLLRKDLQEAAETSKAYQNLLCSTREELKQQQNADSVAQNAEKDSLLQQMSQMNADLLYLREQLLAKKTSETPTLNTEVQDLLTRIASLEEDKAKLQEMLESAREEGTNLRRDLQESEEATLHEVNEHTNAPSNEGRLKVMSEIEACNKKLKVSFLKLQAITDRPKPRDHLADVNRNENTLFCQLLPFVPVSQRSVFACLTSETSRLDDLLRKNEVALQRLAALHKAHFVKQINRDMASFEERRLHDVLIRRAQAPSQSLQMLPGDFQEIWDQRLLELLEKRRQYLQNVNSILDFLEDGVAKHAVTLSEELQARTRANEESSRVLAGTANTAAIVQFFERELVRRTALTDRQRVFHQSMLDKYGSAVSVLKPMQDESVQRLKEERSESLALLPSQSSEKPKTEADLLQDKQRLFLQLQQAQKHLEVLQKKMAELKAQTDISIQKHATELEELSSALKEKEDLIQNLQVKLKESEALAKVKMPPSAAEMEAMKDKLVKMEFDHIAVTTSHEKEIAQLTSVVEHRGDVIRKLKETLRKSHLQDEQSFMDGEEPPSKPGTQAKTSTYHKDKKIEELEKKTAQFESLVNKQQEEICKWKNRAYKLRESKKEAPHSPRTPTKRTLLTECEVNSPKKAVLDSPKSKFFDVHSGRETMSLKCPKQFFDNSSLGTMPAEPAMDDPSESDEDAGPNAAVSCSDTSADSWWSVPNSSPRKTNLNLDANACPTQ